MDINKIFEVVQKYCTQPENILIGKYTKERTIFCLKGRVHISTFQKIFTIFSARLPQGADRIQETQRALVKELVIKILI